MQCNIQKMAILETTASPSSYAAAFSEVYLLKGADIKTIRNSALLFNRPKCWG